MKFSELHGGDLFAFRRDYEIAKKSETNFSVYSKSYRDKKSFYLKENPDVSLIITDFKDGFDSKVVLLYEDIQIRYLPIKGDKMTLDEVLYTIDEENLHIFSFPYSIDTFEKMNSTEIAMEKFLSPEKIMNKSKAKRIFGECQVLDIQKHPETNSADISLFCPDYFRKEN